MRKSQRWLCAAAACALSAGAAVSALAQTDEGYAAKGLPLGGFRLFPTLDVGANYDDNIYRTNTNSIDDYYFGITPAFLLQSQWARHELDVYGTLSDYQYSTHTHEDHTDWTLGGNGRVDVLRGIDVLFGGSYGAQHEQRISPDQPLLAKSPTFFDTGRANVAFQYHPYHFDLEVGGTYVHYDYDATAIISGPPLSNADRNRDEFQGFIKAAYEFSPGYATYVEFTERDVQYTQKFDRNGLRRDNQGQSVDAGLDMAITDLVQGQLFVGYLQELYNNPLPDISGFDYGANVDWDISPRWTLHLTGSRLLNGTTLNGASAEDDQSVRLGADFAPQPDLKFNGYVGYLDENFNGIARDDQYVTTGIKAYYYLNRVVNVDLGYEYQTRSSTAAGQGFNDNHVLVGLNLQL